MSVPPQPNVKLTNAPDYREAYANSVQMRVNVWDFFLVFGTVQQQSETQVEIRNFQGIYLSPQQAKALLGLLQQNVSGYETAFGEIKLDPRMSPAGPGALNGGSPSARCGDADGCEMPSSALPQACGDLTVRPSVDAMVSALTRLWCSRSSLCLFFCCTCLSCGCLTSGTKPATTFRPRATSCSRGSLIPHSTVSNAHPPLVMAWLALWWKVVGYAPLVTRTAMLVLAAFSLLGVFRLAERVANTSVAIAATLCTALYPVFFAQSSLAQVDLAAAGLTFWALRPMWKASRRHRPLVFPRGIGEGDGDSRSLALAGWEIIGLLARRSSFRKLWLG